MPELRDLRQDNRSVGELLGQLTEDITLLFRQELQLAKTELNDKISHITGNVVSVATGGVVAYVGVLAITSALILFLAQVVDITPWLAALLVGLVFAVGGYLMLRRGMTDLKQMDMTPRRTVQSRKEDVQWAKEQRP
jgi:hypothetical protein